VRTIASINHIGNCALDSRLTQPHTAVMSPEPDACELRECLRDDLGHRRIQHGISVLEKMRPVVQSLEPRNGAGILLGLVAQWVDAGFDSPSLIAELVPRFATPARSALPLADYLHIRMAQGFQRMSNEEFDGAAGEFRAVLLFEEEVDDAELFAIANFWLGRCLRKRGRYDEALEYTRRGEHIALSRGYHEMAAIMEVTLSWLSFQSGRLLEAIGMLQRAEEALQATDDRVSRGNIQSAYGRIARRQGKYEMAVERFQRGIAELRGAGAGSLALARTLSNLAFVKRLLAQRAQRESDRLAAARRGQTGKAEGTPPDMVREQRQQIAQMRSEARACLREASAIYETRQNHRGIADVRITEGFLHLDSGDLEDAAAEANNAFEHGAEKSNYFVMARARTLQCIVEHAAIEEQVGRSSEHRENAETFAREAVEFAGRTENRRLLARALVWQGLTFAAEPADLEAARRCCEQALALLQPEGQERQYVWEDLESLKARVLHAQPVDTVLRAWSAGIVEGQSFQQMTEQFARIVIPRVWEREGCKVSRVAEKLSISPKKVRRILQAVGRRASD